MNSSRIRMRVALSSGWLAASAALLVPTLAQAQCVQDSDCGPGYECRTYTSGGAAGAGGDGSVEPCNDPMCQPFEYTQCEPAACSTDADCPDSMRCYGYTYTVCDGGAGAGGSMGSAGAAGGGVMLPPDEPTEPPTCWQETGPSTCAVRYTLPCTVNADCGAGFACVESIGVTCSGGGFGGMGGGEVAGAGGSAGSGTAGAAGGAMDPVGMGGSAGGSVEQPPFECMPYPTGYFYCELQNTPCDSDADCESGLECANNPAFGSCSGAAGAGGSSMGAAGDSGPICTEAPEHVCLPPGYYGSGGAGGATGGGDGMGTGGFGGGDPQFPSAGSGGSAPGGSAGSGGASGAGGSNDEDNGGGKGHHHHGHGHHGRGLHHLLGCSAAGSAGHSTFGWIGLAVAALITRRRKLLAT